MSLQFDIQMVKNSTMHLFFVRASTKIFYVLQTNPYNKYMLISLDDHY